MIEHHTIRIGADADADAGTGAGITAAGIAGANAAHNHVMGPLAAVD
jgi:hypothetical protein